MLEANMRRRRRCPIRTRVRVPGGELVVERWRVQGVDADHPDFHVGHLREPAPVIQGCQDVDLPRLEAESAVARTFRPWSTAAAGSHEVNVPVKVQRAERGRQQGDRQRDGHYPEGLPIAEGPDTQKPRQYLVGLRLVVGVPLETGRGPRDHHIVELRLPGISWRVASTWRF